MGKLVCIIWWILKMGGVVEFGCGRLRGCDVLPVLYRPG